MDVKYIKYVLYILSAIVVLESFILFKIFFSSRANVYFGRAIIPIGKSKGMVCMFGYCAIIPKNSEFILAIGNTTNCSKVLVVYPFNKVLVYGAYCNNSTMYKIMESVEKSLS